MKEQVSGGLPKVNGDRLWHSLQEHSRVGDLSGGGVCREALTAADRDGRDLFARWCREAGMTVDVDRIGNMYANRPGTDPDLLPVAIGSHLDTQPSGGRYDGTLGVLGGLEVIRCLNDAGVTTRRSIELVNWTSEEGSRFKTSMLGSGTYAGIISLSEALAEQDSKGISVADALSAIGYFGEAAVGSRKFHSFLELHIEQGPVLEAQSKEIGVVTGSQAMSWNEVRISGRTAHAGTAPMSHRLDPMQAAMRVLSSVFSFANATPDARLTVGSISTKPSSHSTVPGEVCFLLDMRHHDEGVLDSMKLTFETAAELERKRGHEVVRDEYASSPAQSFDSSLQGIIRDAALERGYSCMEIVSGAGHDAVYINRVCPSAMVFVPCLNGVSHHPTESITPAQALAGTDVLLGALMHAAN